MHRCASNLKPLGEPERIELDGEKVSMLVNKITLDQGQNVDLREFKTIYWYGEEKNGAAGLGGGALQ